MYPSNNVADSVVRFLSSNSNEQFVIPNYQRRYAWEKKQVLDLFYDVYYLDEGRTHLLNMTIVIPSKTGRGISETRIVDGQQRITTLILLIKVLLEKYKGLEKGEENDPLRDMENCLYAHTTYDRKLKLKLGKLDNKEFENIIENPNNLPEDGFKTKLINAYSILEDEIDRFTRENVLEFWEKLKNDIKIIRYGVDQSGDAYKLFEITNNRGIDLTKTDIIKNFVLGHAAIIVEKFPDAEKQLNSVLQKWQSIIVNLEGIHKDEFFRHFLMGKLYKKIPFSQLIGQFKEYYFNNVKSVELLTEYKRYESNKKLKKSTQPRQIKDFLDDLVKASKVYRQIVNEDIQQKDLNREINNLNSIEAKPSYTFLLALIRKMNMEEIGVKEVVEVVKILQIFQFRRHICSYPATGKLDEIYSKLCELTSENIVQNVNEKLNSESRSVDDFQKEFPEYDYKGKVDRAKYVLEQIEYKINPSSVKIIDSTKVELEHIIPQKIKPNNSKKFGDWEEYLGEKDTNDHPLFLNKIGNLTLLTKELNLKASNKPFLNKRDAYKEIDDVKITTLLIHYKYFKQKNVHERSKWLAKKAIEIWKF